MWYCDAKNSGKRNFLLNLSFSPLLHICFWKLQNCPIPRRQSRFCVVLATPDNHREAIWSRKQQLEILNILDHGSFTLGLSLHRKPGGFPSISWWLSSSWEQSRPIPLYLKSQFDMFLAHCIYFSPEMIMCLRVEQKELTSLSFPLCSWIFRWVFWLWTDERCFWASGIAAFSRTYKAVLRCEYLLPHALHKGSTAQSIFSADTERSQMKFVSFIQRAPRTSTKVRSESTEDVVMAETQSGSRKAQDLKRQMRLAE